MKTEFYKEREGKKMKTKTIVWVSTLFEGCHRWLSAPNDVSFLRNYHRHIFDVKLGVEVTGDDREIEFFQLKRKVDKYINKQYEGKSFDFSCEMIAKQLLIIFNACFVEVSEDGENGATVSV